MKFLPIKDQRISSPSIYQFPASKKMGTFKEGEPKECLNGKILLLSPN